MYKIVEARGLSSVAEGREFIIPDHMPLQPPTDDNELFRVTYEGEEPARVVPVAEGLSICCPDCSGAFQYALSGHTIQWMYAALHCANHPLEAAYIDVFPKRGVDTAHDWSNSFFGNPSSPFIENQELGPPRPENVLAKLVTGRAVLTPRGLRTQPIPTIGLTTRSRAAFRWQKVRERIDDYRDGY